MYGVVLLLRYPEFRKCSVTLPHGAMDWSSVCDCGVSWSYLFISWIGHKNTLTSIGVLSSLVVNQSFGLGTLYF